MGLEARQPTRVPQRFCKPFAAHRFEQIIDRVGLEGLQGIVIVSRGKDNRRRLLQCLQMLRGLQAIHTWHANIH